MTAPLMPLPMSTVAWWLPQWSRPVSPCFFKVRPNTLYIAQVTRSFT